MKSKSRFRRDFLSAGKRNNNRNRNNQREVTFNRSALIFSCVSQMQYIKEVILMQCISLHCGTEHCDELFFVEMVKWLLFSNTFKSWKNFNQKFFPFERSRIWKNTHNSNQSSFQNPTKHKRNSVLKFTWLLFHAHPFHGNTTGKYSNRIDMSIYSQHIDLLKFISKRKSFLKFSPNFTKKMLFAHQLLVIGLVYCLRLTMAYFRYQILTYDCCLV